MVTKNAFKINTQLNTGKRASGVSIQQNALPQKGSRTNTPNKTKQADPIGTGKVTCSALNVRSGAGTNFARIGGLTKGKSFQVYEEKDGWLKIKYGSKDGWIAKQYTDYISPKPPVTEPDPGNNTEPDPGNNTQPDNPPSSFEQFQVKVTSDNGLNVRDIPGNGENAASGSSILGGIPNGEIVTVLDEQNSWYKINYNGREAWICGVWTEKYTGGNNNDNPGGGAVSNNGVPLYSQSDSRWGSRILCVSETIASSGCAMTSTAMCISKISGRNITPAELDQYLDEHGGYTVQNWIYWGTAAGMIGCGAASTTMTGNKGTIDRNLDAGRPVVISVNDGNHYVCVAGRNGDGSYIIHDPAGGVVKGGHWDGSNIIVDGYPAGDQLVYFT